MALSKTHFSLSLHVLTTLAVLGDKGISSTVLAEGAGTNPAFLRHVIGKLRTAGLVDSRQGNQGGIWLALSADDITVADVYRAVEGETYIASHDCPGDPACPVSSNFDEILSGITKQVDSAIIAELSGVTIKALADDAMAKSR